MNKQSEQHHGDYEAPTTKVCSSAPFPVINTLKVELLSENSTKYIPCLPNAREPLQFETEFFKGVATLIIRTSPVDDYFRSFFMGKRQFEVQVQGKFKREPLGEIYVGAEVTNKMELGMLTRSISKAALRFCGTMVSDLHYSFGDSTSDINHQVPHLVAPIFPTFDKVLVTPPGGVLPLMNIPFNEDLDYRKQRMKFRLIADAKVDINNTYSFSVNTSNLNLLDWTLVGVPMVRPMDLRTFFSNASINLVGYEIPHSVVADFPNSHPKKLLNYVFSMRLTPVEPSDVNSLPVMDFPLGSSDDEEPEEVQDDDLVSAYEHPSRGATFSNKMLHDAGAPKICATVATANVINNNSDDDIDLEPVGDDEDCELMHQDILHSKVHGCDSEAIGGSKKTSRIGGWFRRHMGSAEKEVTLAANTTAGPEIDVLESSEYSPTDYDMESNGDLKFCPACLELNDCRKDGKRRVLYFMPVLNPTDSVMLDNSLSFEPVQLALPADNVYPALRAYSEIAKSFILSTIPRMHKNKRLSNNEKRRRQIVETYKAIVKSGNHQQITKLNQFLGQLTDADRAFLNGNMPVQHKSKSSQKYHNLQHSIDDSWEGSIALATSRRHWSEHYIVLTKAEISFFRSIDSRKAVFSIALSSVASVQPMRIDEVPMLGFSFLQIETFSRIYYLMVRSDMQLNEWMQAFITLLGGQIMRSPFDPSHGTIVTGNGPACVPPLIDAEDELYIAKSACWKLDKKRVFNCRRIIFNPSGLTDKWRKISPNNLIESILCTAISIAHFEQPNKPNSLEQQQLTLLWVRFLDEISLLQTVNVSILSERERMVFFLNLYHVMVIHGHMTIGPPPSWNYWNAFFNHITYLIGYEIVSIGDVDHNLLRSAMSRPSSLSVIPVPLTHFPGMALTHRDFRLNFCINNGSKSMPAVVPVYKAHCVDRQLDEMTTLNLASSVEVDVVKRVIVLPKISMHDFTPRRVSGSNASSLDCLRSLLSYLRRDDKLNILKLISSDTGFIPVVRFKNPSLRCRAFQVLAGDINSSDILGGALVTDSVSTA